MNRKWVIRLWFKMKDGRIVESPMPSHIEGTLSRACNFARNNIASSGYIRARVELERK